MVSQGGISMMTVSEMSKRTGVSIRTLHHYDEMGLLKPAHTTEAGYRMYDDASLERLQMILLFKELEFPLKEIARILDSPDYDRNRALEQQIEMLNIKKEHLENVLLFARTVYMLGVNYMDFSAFDTKKMDDYANQAKALWGKTDAYKEFEEKQKSATEEDNRNAEKDIMNIFCEFGAVKHLDPADQQVQALVAKLRAFITEHFYNCTPEILKGLGKMYACGGAFTESIDGVGGEGTAVFSDKAIEIYVENIGKK